MIREPLKRCFTQLFSTNSFIVSEPSIKQIHIHTIPKHAPPSWQLLTLVEREIASTLQMLGQTNAQRNTAEPLLLVLWCLAFMH